MKKVLPKSSFAVCVRNDGYVASLELRKIYRVLPDPDAAAHQLIRVEDESGDDYLYPANYFLPIRLPPPVKRALASPLASAGFGDAVLREKPARKYGR